MNLASSMHTSLFQSQFLAIFTNQYPVFLFHFLPGAMKKVQFGTRELAGANIHKPHST